MSKCIVSIKRLSKDAVLPKYQTEEASGMDLVSVEDHCIYRQSLAMVRTGISISIPCGYEGQIRSRSGIAVMHNIVVLHGIGTIDSDYRGEIVVPLFNHGCKTVDILAGTRIAQLVISPVIKACVMDVEDLPKILRGCGGFGSTGK